MLRNSLLWSHSFFFHISRKFLLDDYYAKVTVEMLYRMLRYKTVFTFKEFTSKVWKEQ